MIKTLKEFIEDQEKTVDMDKLRFDGNFIYDILPQHLELVEVTLTENESLKYKFNPKMLSYDVYKSTEYWFLILLANKFKHIHEFTLTDSIMLPTTKSINTCITLQSIYGDTYATKG